MAITLNGTPTASRVASTTSISVALPTGVLNNDYVLVLLSVANARTFTPPSGYSVIPNCDQSGTGPGTACFFHIYSTGDPTSVSFSMSGTANHMEYICTAYTGVNNTTPHDASNSQLNASSLTMATPSISPVGAADMLLMLVFEQANQSTVASNTLGTVQASWLTGGPATAYADFQLTSAGATGSQSITFTGTASIGGGFQVALLPATSAGLESNWDYKASVPTATKRARSLLVKGATNLLFRHDVLSKKGAPSPQGPTWPQPVKFDPKINFRSRASLLIKASGNLLFQHNLISQTGSPSPQGPTYPSLIEYGVRLLQYNRTKSLVLKAVTNLYYTVPIPAPPVRTYAPQVQRPKKNLRLLVSKAAQQLYNNQYPIVTFTGYTKTHYQSNLFRRPPPRLVARAASNLYYNNGPNQSGSPAPQGPTYPSPVQLDVNASRKYRNKLTRAAANYLLQHDLISKTGSPSGVGPTWPQTPCLNINAARNYRNQLVHKAANYLLQHDLISQTGSPSSQGPTWPQPVQQDVAASRKYRNKLIIKAATQLYNRSLLSKTGSPSPQGPTYPEPPHLDINAARKYRTRLIVKSSNLLYRQNLPNQFGSPAPQGPTYPEPAHINVNTQRKARQVLIGKASQLLYKQDLPNQSGSPAPQGPTWNEPPHLDVNAARKYRNKLIRAASNYLFHNLFSNTGSPSSVGPTYPEPPHLDVSKARKYNARLGRIAANLLFQHDLLSKTGSPSPQGPTWNEPPHLDIAASRKYRNKLITKASELLYRQNNPNQQGSPAGIGPTWPQPIQLDVNAARKYRDKLIKKASNYLLRNLPMEQGSPAPQGPTYVPSRLSKLVKPNLAKKAANQLYYQNSSNEIPQEISYSPKITKPKIRSINKAATQLYYNKTGVSPVVVVQAPPTWAQSPCLNINAIRIARQKLISRIGAILYYQVGRAYGSSVASITPSTWPQPVQVDPKLQLNRNKRLLLKAASNLYQRDLPNQFGSPAPQGPTWPQAPQVDPKLQINRNKKLLKAAGQLYFSHDVYPVKGSPAPQGPTYPEPPHLDINASRKYRRALIEKSANYLLQHDLISKSGSPSGIGPTWPQSPQVDPKLQLNRNKHLVVKAAANLYYQHDVFQSAGSPAPEGPTYPIPPRLDVNAARKYRQSLLRKASSHLLYNGWAVLKGSPSGVGPTWPQPFAGLQHLTLKNVARKRSTRLSVKAAAELLYNTKPYVAAGSPSGVGPTWPQPAQIDPKLALNREKHLLIKNAAHLYYYTGSLALPPIPPPIPQICEHIYAPLSNELSLYCSLGTPNVDNVIIETVYAPLSNVLVIYCPVGTKC